MAAPITKIKPKILLIWRIAFILIAKPLKGGIPAILIRDNKKFLELVFIYTTTGERTKK